MSNICQLYVKYMSNIDAKNEGQARWSRSRYAAMCQWGKKGASLQVVGKAKGGHLAMAFRGY